MFGYGYLAAGSAPGGGNVLDAPPLITVESPLDIAVEWDARTREMTAALRLYDYEGSGVAVVPELRMVLTVPTPGLTFVVDVQHAVSPGRSPRPLY